MDYTAVKIPALLISLYLLLGAEQEHMRKSHVCKSMYDKMRAELVIAWLLQDQRFGRVFFTVGGAEVLMGDRESDAGLFD